MQVTYDKTSHLIFPSAIRYVDLGSEVFNCWESKDAKMYSCKSYYRILGLN